MVKLEVLSLINVACVKKVATSMLTVHHFIYQNLRISLALQMSQRCRLSDLSNLKCSNLSELTIEDIKTPIF